MTAVASQAELPDPPGRNWADQLAWVLWAALLITIPISSHPWVAHFTGWTGVSPLSGVPLVLLLVGWLPWRVVRQRRLPVVALPLLGFVSVALVASAGAFFLPIFPSDGQSVLGRELRALSTLLIGVGFFLVAALLPRGRGQILGSLRWIYAGAMAVLLYSAFQIARLPYSFNPVPERLVAFHRLFSIRDPLRSRVTGFAFEPSWLGDQLVLLYLPLFLASVWLAYSAFSSRRRRWSVELLLLLIGVVVLFFSFARLAWLAFFLMLGSLLAVSLWRRLSGRSPGSELRSSSPSQQRPRARWLLPAVAGLLLTLASLVGLIWVGAALDTRFAASLSADLDTVFYGRHPWPYALANQLKYGERLMYWIAGFRIFSEHPLQGVGLGNAGFLLPSTVPGFAFTLPEAIDTLHKGAYGVPNTKSLWIRLLAETGIVGFALFSAWVAAVGALAAHMLERSEPVAQMIGLAALLAVGAMVVEGFSMDTFALPQMWILPGLAVAAAKLTPASAEDR